MKINLNTKFVEFEENQNMKENGEFLTLRHFCVGSLLIPDAKAAPEKLYDRRNWAKELRDYPGDIIELTAEQIVELKALIAKRYPLPVVIGQAWDILEGKQNGDTPV